MNDAIINEFRDLIAKYLDSKARWNTEELIAIEDAIEDFEAANDGVADAFYQREVAKGGSNAYHDFV